MALGSGLAGSGFSTFGQPALTHLCQSLLPVGISPSFGGTEIPEPTLQSSATGRKGQAQGLGLGVLRGAKHRGADQIISDQSGQPFLGGHLRAMGFQLSRVHLGFDITQVQLHLPAPAIELDQFFQGVLRRVG